jgi:hypothetical protein
VGGTRTAGSNEAATADLKSSRRLAKVAEYSAVLRSDAFDDWVRRCTVTAEEPREWTRASLLYDSYLRHAKSYGANRPDKRLAQENWRPKPLGAR